MGQTGATVIVAGSSDETPWPMKWVTSRCVPSPDQASAHGSAGTAARATTVDVAASISTTVASCEHAA